MDFSVISFDGTTISEVRTTDMSVLCIGPLSWVTNDLNDNLGYFATLAGGEANTVHGYQTTGAGQTHDYNTGVTVNQAPFLDSFVGWSNLGTNPNQPSFNVGVAYLADGSSSDVGPAHDPAYRQINVWNTDFVNTTTPLKTINSLVPVSRAFKHDDEYYAFTYYQSGSGLTVTPMSETVSLHNLVDRMTGAASQVVVAAAGDSVMGAAVSGSSSGVQGSNGQGTTAIASGDTVEVYEVTAGDALNLTYAMPVGTRILKWTLANKTAGASTSALDISACSEPTAIGRWQVCPQLVLTAHVIYTFMFNGNNQSVTPATFTSGSFSIDPLVRFNVPFLPDVITADNVSLYVGGTANLVWSGDSVSGNNGTWPIQFVHFDTTADPNSGYWLPPTNSAYVLVEPASHGASIAAATATIEPFSPGKWSFASAANQFDASYVGSDVMVTPDPLETAFPTTNYPGPFTVTAADAASLTTAAADAAALASYVFGRPPTITVDLPLGIVPYTFSFEHITVDYTYQDAIIVVQGSTIPANNTQYQVVNVDPTNNLLYAQPLDGSTDQRNQLFTSAHETVTIIKSGNIVSPWQPTFFMTPLTGTQAQVGKFDTGIAYADWRLEGDSVLGPNEFPMALGDVCAVPGGIQIDLPYRAQNVTSNLPVATVRGQINLQGASITANTVGLKTWRLSDETGTPALNSGELLLPGPMAGEFTLSGFSEDGISLGFEQAYLKGQSTAPSGQLGLTQNARYQYVVVGEYTDRNGSRIFTPPSPPLNVHLTAGNNVVTLQGRAMNPIASDGTLIPGESSTTNRLVGISIYRVAIEGTGANAQPTVQRYKITNDLAVNGLAPTSALNSSGFSFPDDFTWQYVDQNPDVSILGAEQLYVDKGYLTRYPAPAFYFGIGSWKNRTWVIASDGSIWMSGEKTEGDAVWFHPALRYVLPTDDRPISMAVMEDNLIVFCEAGSVWQIPAAVFPDATGRNGTLPTPIQLPFNVVCTGHAVSLRSAVAFSSDVNGASVWAITRDLKLVWLSQPLQDDLNQPITGLTVSADQRLHVATGFESWFVYDQIVDVWYEYALPVNAALPTTTNGLAAFQDDNRVFVYDPTSFTDFDGTTHFRIAPDVTLADVDFGTVRGLKSVWEMQLVGTYKGPHRLNIELSYPDEYQEPTTVFDPVTPDPDAPYIIPFNPMVEEAASYGIRFYADFVGVESPGDSFEVEVITAEVGIDRKSGATKLPDASTAVATDE